MTVRKDIEIFMLQLLHISTQPCHIPLTIKPKVSLCCVQEEKCWDISPIYCVSEGFDTINHGNISERRNFRKYHQKIANISIGGDKSSIFFINLLSQKKIAHISSIYRWFFGDALLCPDSLSPANLLLGLHSPLCLYMRPPWFHLPSAQAYQFAEAPLSQPKNIFENKLIIIIIKKYKNNHHNLFS